jgi:hypothetical protein
MCCMCSICCICCVGCSCPLTARWDVEVGVAQTEEFCEGGREGGREALTLECVGVVGLELGLEVGRELGLELGRELDLELGRELGCEGGREVALEVDLEGVRVSRV